MDKLQNWFNKWADWVDDNNPKFERYFAIAARIYNYIWALLAFFVVSRLSKALWQALNHHWQKAWNYAKADFYGGIGFIVGTIIVLLFLFGADKWGKKRQ